MIILLFFLSFSVFAKPGYKLCNVEIKEFCSDKEGPEISTCLLEQKNLSIQCKQEIQRISKIMKDAGASGGGLSSFGGVLGGFGLVSSDKSVINYSGAIAPEKDPASISQHKITVATPLYRNETETISLSADAGNLVFSENQEELKRVDLGINYSKKLPNKRSYGIRSSFGSASDKLFHSYHEMSFMLNGYYSFPAEKKNRRWISTVFISNNNPIINYIPIPGIIYLYREGTFTGMFGLPFTNIQWTPIDPWGLSLSFFIVTYKVEITYGKRNDVQIFSGFNVAQQSFLRHDREDVDDRTYFAEKKIYLGFRSPLQKNVNVEFQAGQTFDRRIFEGESSLDASDDDIAFGRSWYGSLNVTLTI